MSKSRGASVAAKIGARLIAQLAAGVAAGDVGQREQPDLRVARQLCGLAGGAVHRLARPLGLLVQEGRLVNEQVGLVGGDRRAPRTARVSPEITTLRPSRLAPITCSRLHSADGFAALQARRSPGRA